MKPVREPVTRAMFAQILSTLEQRSQRSMRTAGGALLPVLILYEVEGGAPKMQSIIALDPRSAYNDTAAAVIAPLLLERLADLVVFVHEAWALELPAGTTAEAARQLDAAGAIAAAEARREVALFALYSREVEYVVPHPIVGTGEARTFAPLPLPADDPNTWAEGMLSIHGRA